jgi:anaerobic ribonucleoside-triphosphate reductase activating protein
MKIASTQISINKKSLEIYVSGCDGTCTDCHNEELHSFDIGTDYKKIMHNILDKLRNPLIEKVFILGGEPLLQNRSSMIDMISFLKKGKRDIFLFTRFEIEQIDNDILELVDYIKTGKYIKNLKTENNLSYGIKLASSNQKIWRKINDNGKIIWK